MKKYFTKKNILLSLLVALILFSIFGLLYWNINELKADSKYLNLAKTEKISIAEDSYQFWIKPIEKNNEESAIIFYPGANVQPEAYIYNLSAVARETNTQIFIPKMFLRLAIFGVNSADKIIADHYDIKNWFISGHSLGGAMACEYAKNHTDKIKAIMHMGSYCAADISKTNLKVLTLAGQFDGLATPEKVNASLKNLPKDNQLTVITGMNHSRFGTYGKQQGDNDPDLTVEEGRDVIAEHISNFFLSKFLDIFPMPDEPFKDVNVR